MTSKNKAWNLWNGAIHSTGKRWQDEAPYWAFAVKSLIANVDHPSLSVRKRALSLSVQAAVAANAWGDAIDRKSVV